MGYRSVCFNFSQGVRQWRLLCFAWSQSLLESRLWVLHKSLVSKLLSSFRCFNDSLDTKRGGVCAWLLPYLFLYIAFSIFHYYPKAHHRKYFGKDETAQFLKIFLKYILLHFSLKILFSMLFKKEQLHSDIFSLPKWQILDKVTIKLHSKSEILTENFCDSEYCIYPWSMLLAFRDHTWNNISWWVPNSSPLKRTV